MTRVSGLGRAGARRHWLDLARSNAGFRKLLDRLTQDDLLILDDSGLSAIESDQARDLLGVIDDRAEPRSTLIAS